MIGIDIVDINRFKNKKYSFLSKVFSKKEISETTKSNINQKLAGKWAAKEAAYKAGLKYANKEIEILTKNNKPFIFINGKQSSYKVSISHEKRYATAIVIKYV
jgi:holo-[acyl-carrier protein] synthase